MIKKKWKEKSSFLIIVKTTEASVKLLAGDSKINWGFGKYTKYGNYQKGSISY